MKYDLKADGGIMANELKAALITAVSTLAVGIIGAGVNLGVAYFHIGEKDTARPADQRGVIGTISAGHAIASRLADPTIPLNQVLPQVQSASQPTVQQQPAQQPPSNPVPNPPQLTADPFITDPVVLAACIGAQPLKVQRLRIDPDPKGYGVTVDLSNGSGGQISVWEDGNPTLKNDAGDVLPPGATNVPTTNYYTFVSEEQAALAHAFTDGLSAAAGEVVPMHFTFQQRDSLHTAGAISFAGNFRYVLKDAEGKYTLLKRSLSCSGVPVKRIAVP